VSIKTGRHQRRARAGRSAARIAIFLALALFVIFRSRQQRAVSTRDESARATSATPSRTAKYVPTGDEGLGAAVAIMVDNSGSMRETAGGDSRPKFVVARQALEEMLASTDSFAAKQPGFPIKVGLYYFSSGVHPLVPVQPYDAASLRAALESMPTPTGGTAIGEAMDTARDALYRSGIIRKYILVVTDGENTDGRSPREVAQEIAARSEGAVRMYFVAFDVDAKKFSFLRDVHGEVLGAGNALGLRASLDTIYRGRILAEAVDAGETAPSSTTPPTKRP
jgi:Mg-chelatase subunit ChlD